MRGHSAQSRDTAAASLSAGWHALFVLALLATMEVGLSLQASDKTTRSASTQQPDVVDTPPRPRVATPVASPPSLHRHLSIKNNATSREADLSAFVQIAGHTPVPMPPPPNTTDPAAAQSTSPQTLPPESGAHANPVASSRSSRLDPALFPELAQEPQMLPRTSASNTRLRERARQSVRKNNARAVWQHQRVSWDPTNLFYTPLYFEDERLERHGHNLGIFQPVASGIRFFGTVPALPYLATQQPPGTAVYPPRTSASNTRLRERARQSVRKNNARALWQRRRVSWDPTNLFYTPLYFEDERLERHGHNLGIFQPVASGIRFFGTVPALPYLATQQPPGTAVYPLGQTRPGNQIAPYHVYPSFHWKAALVEAGSWIGFFALFP